jgi:hypothetical protein
MRRCWIVLALVGVVAVVGAPAAAARTVFYGGANPAGGGGGGGGAASPAQLFTIDVATGVGTAVGNLPSVAGPPLVHGSTEIECKDTAADESVAVCFSQSPDGDFHITQFDLATGAATSAPVDDHASFSGLEFIGDDLYGTTIADPLGGTHLRILHAPSGVSTDIGNTGVGPISGIAYDGTTLYGIAGGRGGSTALYTLSLTTGLATVVGNTGIHAGSLQFGPDGNLYAGTTGTTGGELYRIDPATGAATLVGATGFASVTGLTLVTFPDPVPVPPAPPAPAPVAVAVTPTFAG